MHSNLLSDVIFLISNGFWLKNDRSEPMGIFLSQLLNHVGPAFSVVVPSLEVKRMLLGCYGLAVSMLSRLIILVLKGLLPAVNFHGPRDFEVGWGMKNNCHLFLLLLLVIFKLQKFDSVPSMSCFLNESSV